jgi:hypothetical protein
MSDEIRTAKGAPDDSRQDDRAAESTKPTTKTPNPALREGFLVILAGEPENQETLRRFGDLLHTMVGETVRAPCPVPMVQAEAEAALVDLIDLTERLQEAASYADEDQRAEMRLGAVTKRQTKSLRKVIAALEAGLAEFASDEEDDEEELDGEGGW